MCLGFVSTKFSSQCPFYSSHCIDYHPSFTTCAVLLSIHLNCHFFLISASCKLLSHCLELQYRFLNIQGCMLDLLFHRLLQACLHHQVGGSSFIHYHIYTCCHYFFDFLCGTFEPYQPVPHSSKLLLQMFLRKLFFTNAFYYWSRTPSHPP